MIFKEIKVFVIFCLMVPANVFAQNYADLLRYSQKFYQGTARSAASGNAFGAVGADFSAISINPASLGLYRRPEFTFGFNLQQQSANATYLGTTARDDKFNLNMSNLGLVLADVKYKLGKPVQEGWVSVNFAVGFSRTNNFHNNIAVEGFNTKNSILHSWREQAQGRTYSSLGQFDYPYLASQVGLIQTVDIEDTSTQWEDITQREDPNSYKVFQGDYISTRGAMNDINVSVAGNYSNKIYVGANVSVPTIGYHSTRTFTETNRTPSDGSNPFRYSEMILNDYLHTSGIGITAGFGAIYRASDAIRLGASLQLPSFYSMSDKFNTTMTGRRKDDKFDAETPKGIYNYSIVTPMRANFSSTVLFGKMGFISADFEWVDYSSARINTSSENSRFQNEIARDVLRSVANIRLGGEYRFENFAFRGGYQMHGSPYKSEFVPSKATNSTQILSGGIGLRDADYYVDFAYQYYMNKFYHLPYTLQNQEPDGAIVSNNRSNIMITVGSRF